MDDGTYLKVTTDESDPYIIKVKGQIVMEPLLVRLVKQKGLKEHQRGTYSSIYGKELYPVSFNPLDDDKNAWYIFRKYKNRYVMRR
jgi:hypothetical protein